MKLVSIIIVISSFNSVSKMCNYSLNFIIIEMDFSSTTALLTDLIVNFNKIIELSLIPINIMIENGCSPG